MEKNDIAENIIEELTMDECLEVSGGYMMPPSEGSQSPKEKVLTSIVVAEPHPYKGEAVKAFVVLKPEFKKSDTIDQDLKEHLKKSLSKYMLPAKIEYRETLPTTKMGKADYRNVK